MTFAVLAGPVVRRVESRSASVWIATNESCEITLDVFEEAGDATALPAATISGKRQTLAAGKGLHVSVIMAEIEEPAPAMHPGATYHYNLTFKPAAGTPKTLMDLDLLRDSVGDERPHKALGYGENLLPSFVLPPDDFEELRLIHGSCRRIGFDAPDAMAYIDDLIEPGSAARGERPHQLFLTGDQIYADNLPTAVQRLITQKAAECMGYDEQIPVHFPHPPGTDVPEWHACTPENFPAGLRRNLMLHDARFTTTDGSNHLISFGEFCLMHVLNWSNVLWPKWEDLDRPDKAFAPLAPDEEPRTLWALHCRLLGATPPADTVSPAGAPSKSDKPDKVEILRLDSLSRDHVNEVLAYLATAEEPVASYDVELHATKQFMEGLPRVRRALANVATYMIFDDHEITDDWNLSEPWRDRTATSPLARTITRNGLMAYALFQGWGNDPKAYAGQVRDDNGALVDSAQRRLLEQIDVLFDDDGTPDPIIAREIDTMFRLNGDVSTPTKARMNWSYRVWGPHHLVIVLDVRTQRVNVGRIGPPQNLSADGMAEQLPVESDPLLMHLPENIKVVLVVSSLVVLGPPIFDALFGPIAYKKTDAKEIADRLKATSSNASDGSTPPQDFMPATDPDAIESWPNDEGAFERLLAALAPFKRIVFLSGDVHYASSVQMSYWTDRSSPPSRFAQLIGSALKNDFKAALAWANQSLSIFQKVLRLNDHAERLGWHDFVQTPITTPPGTQILPSLDARLQQKPILIPTQGWPAGSFENTPPDFSWRIDVVRDTRTDRLDTGEAPRPEALRAASLFPGSDRDVDPVHLDLQAVAVRHAKQLGKMNFSRQMMFNTNLGAISFESTAGAPDANGDPSEIITVVHRLHSAFPRADLPAQQEVLMEHRIPLDVPGDVAPHIRAES